MVRAYAGVLGYTAWSVVLVRVAKDGGAVESAFLAAVVALFVFAAIGAVIGQLAINTVHHSVRGRLAGQIALGADQDKSVPRS